MAPPGPAPAPGAPGAIGAPGSVIDGSGTGDSMVVVTVVVGAVVDSVVDVVVDDGLVESPLPLSEPHAAVKPQASTAPATAVAMGIPRTIRPTVM